MDGQGRELAVLAAGERLRISREGSLLRLDRPDATDPALAAPLRVPLQDLAFAPAVAVAGVAAEPGALVGLGRRAYRGSLLVRPEGMGLLALNLISLESYLPSVVGSEMPARWPAAALRAQAVAARTYALAQVRPAAPFDLKATVASQAYLGVEAETDSTRAAVAATRALVLRHGGALIDAVFHSSSGGSTENSGEIWNRQLPYLTSVPDRDDLSPWRQWTVRFDPDQLRRAFREIDGASRIEVLAASSTGRVRLARVTGPAGSLDLSGSELRQRLGLRSTLVRFHFEEPAPPVPGGPGGITSATALAAAEAAGGRGAPGPPAPPPPLPPLGAAAGPRLGGDGAGGDRPGEVLVPLLSPPPPSLEVVGRGFGHGVGMSQWGAYALALRGKDYGDILRYYYRGAELVTYGRP
jgi:stage II sporulation protein D